MRTDAVKLKNDSNVPSKYYKVVHMTHALYSDPFDAIWYMTTYEDDTEI